jgi:ABC-2 type transport system permease protein
MRLYLAIAERSFQRHLAYRAAALAGVFTNSIFGGVIAAVYLAFYRETGEETVAGYSVDEAMTYVWVAQALLAPVAIWGWWEMAHLIRTGDVVADLMKPFDFYLYWLSQDLGRAASQILLRFLPTFAIGAIFFDLALPTSPARWLAFALSLQLAIVVSFGIRFLFNVSAFWLTDVMGIRMFSLAVVNFLSGQYVPLAFFPDWLRQIANALPFRAMFMTPIEVLLGKGSLSLLLGQQLFWIVVLTAAGYATLGRAVRKVVVQGG